jgi:hypothetical protein
VLVQWLAMNMRSARDTAPISMRRLRRVWCLGVVWKHVHPAGTAMCDCLGTASTKGLETIYIIVSGARRASWHCIAKKWAEHSDWRHVEIRVCTASVNLR